MAVMVTCLAEDIGGDMKLDLGQIEGDVGHDGIRLTDDQSAKQQNKMHIHYQAILILIHVFKFKRFNNSDYELKQHTYDWTERFD